MNDDQLRDRIGRLDPLAGSDCGDASIEPVSSPAARALLEDIMNTPLSLDRPASPSGGGRDRPWWAMVGAAAATIAVVAVGVAVLTSGNGDDDQQIAAPTTVAAPAPTEPSKLKVLELSTGETDPMIQMCIEISPEVIADAQVAFRAVVDTVEADIVTMTIDEWYQGGDAQVVTLSAPAGLEALLGGIPFVPGEQVLVTAYEGVVNYCGMSGPATPELQSLFDQAFPA